MQVRTSEHGLDGTEGANASDGAKGAEGKHLMSELSERLQVTETAASGTGTGASRGCSMVSIGALSAPGLNGRLAKRGSRIDALCANQRRPRRSQNERRSRRRRAGTGARLGEHHRVITQSDDVGDNTTTRASRVPGGISRCLLVVDAPAPGGYWRCIDGGNDDEESWSIDGAHDDEITNRASVVKSDFWVLCRYKFSSKTGLTHRSSN